MCFTLKLIDPLCSHVEPFAEAPPPRAPTVVTARHRIANATRVSLYAAGYDELVVGHFVGLAGGPGR